MLCERTDSTCDVPLGQSLPFYYKLAALALFHTVQPSRASLTHNAAPLLVVGAVLGALYVHPLLTARIQHKDLALHLVSVLGAFFTYLNAVLLCTLLCPGAELLLSTLCAMHLLHAVAASLAPSLHDGLLPAQAEMRLLLSLLKLAVVPLTWLATQHISEGRLDVQAVVYCLFMPETLGLLLQALFALL